MGHLQADEMANMVEGGAISLREVLGWHLQYNHYPPLPGSLIDVAEKAIEHTNKGEEDALIELPQGMARGDTGEKMVRAWWVIESMHLDSFLSSEEGDSDDETD